MLASWPLEAYGGGGRAMAMKVFVAPVPADIFASALEIPALLERVAFGSNKEGLDATNGEGLPVFIYVSSDKPHPLYAGPKCSWGGTLGVIEMAEQSGWRRGKHKDSSVRPVYAESDDRPAMYFWEVLGLHKLPTALPFGRFKTVKGGSPFVGGVPRWPTVAWLVE